MRFPLLGKTIKWCAVAGLLLAAMSWHAAANTWLLLSLIVSIGAILVVQQAVRAKQYLWASAFVGMALLLNPVAPIFTPAGNLLLLLLLAGLSPILITCAAWRDAAVSEWA